MISFAKSVPLARQHLINGQAIDSRTVKDVVMVIDKQKWNPAYLTEPVLSMQLCSGKAMKLMIMFVKIVDSDLFCTTMTVFSKQCNFDTHDSPHHTILV